MVFSKASATAFRSMQHTIRASRRKLFMTKQSLSPCLLGYSLMLVVLDVGAAAQMAMAAVLEWGWKWHGNRRRITRVRSSRALLMPHKSKKIMLLRLGYQNLAPKTPKPRFHLFVSFWKFRSNHGSTSSRRRPLPRLAARLSRTKTKPAFSARYRSQY